jgi:hypothetical protein
MPHSFEQAQLLQVGQQTATLDGPPLLLLLFSPHSAEGRAAYESKWGRMPPAPKGELPWVGAPKALYVFELCRMLRAFAGRAGDAAAERLTLLHSWGSDIRKWFPAESDLAATVMPFTEPVRHHVLFHDDSVAIASTYAAVSLRFWGGQYLGSEVAEIQGDEQLDRENPSIARCDTPLGRTLVCYSATPRDALISHRLASAIIRGHATYDDVSQCVRTVFAQDPRGPARVAEATRALRRFRGETLQFILLERVVSDLLRDSEMHDFHRAATAELSGPEIVVD